MPIFDGEAATADFLTLQDNTPVVPTLVLPNKELWDCCSDFKLLSLADDSGNNEQNDFFTFMDICAPTASAAVYKIYKNNVLLATMSGGSVYGVDYPFGFQTLNGNSYVGYKVEWYKVLALHGAGIYKVELAVTDAILGNGNIFSFEFKLCEYRADKADGTIRLQWYQNGTIGSIADDKRTVDYLGLNWVNQIRLPGFFGYPSADYVKENIQYQNGVREWTFDEQEPIYILKTKRIPAQFHNLFRVSIMQSDRCTITDYNTINAEKYVDKEIMFQTEYKPVWKPLISKLAEVQLEVKQRYNNYKKHRN
jgi:hypothetical protein